MKSLVAAIVAFAGLAMSAGAGVSSALHVVYAKARIVEAVDADCDGLDDAAEAALGTDPTLADTDGDGLFDGDEEILVNTSALLVDSDGDGFGDGLELAAGADPLSAASRPVTVAGTIINDTPLEGRIFAEIAPERAGAFDGLLAGNAATALVCRVFSADASPASFAFTNAVATGAAFTITAWADVTGDGVRDDWEPAADYVYDGDGGGGDQALDDIEIVLAFDESVDSDSNGLPDAWEWRCFGVLGNSASADPDGDGLDNADEFQYGTDPLDDDTDFDGMSDGNEVFFGYSPIVPDKLPQPFLTRTANGYFRLEWDTRYGQGYMPQYSDSLVPPAWSNLVPNAIYDYTSDPYGSASVIDRNTNAPARFYRIQLLK